MTRIQIVIANPTPKSINTKIAAARELWGEAAKITLETSGDWHDADGDAIFSPVPVVVSGRSFMATADGRTFRAYPRTECEFTFETLGTLRLHVESL